MQRVWPRCPKCGRRWQAVHPACGTEVAPLPAAGDDAAASAPLPAIDGYVVDRLLGRGGFGDVVLASRVADGRKVAIKIPKDDTDAIMRLELEGEVLRQLGGVHAPALYDTPELADGRPCVAMEFVPMPTLADRLGELENGMPIEEIRRRGLSLLTALKAVHALDLVHRDLKPENVFSTDLPPVTRIFDFGLVKPPAGVPQQDTTVGTFMGTPEYMAPEQLDSSAPVDQRADIYAIGALFYEMLAGRPPFWGNAAEVQQALANRRAPRPSRHVAGAPPALEDVILRCLAKDPVRRFASTDDLAAAFAAALDQTRSAAAPATAPAPPASATPPDAKASATPAKRPMAVLAVHGIAVDVLMKALASGGGHLVEVGPGRRRRPVHRQGEREPRRPRDPDGRRPARAQGVPQRHRRSGGGRGPQEAGRQRPLRQRRVRQAAEAARGDGRRRSLPDRRGRRSGARTARRGRRRRGPDRGAAASRARTTR